jgi:beta-galactosidase
MCSVTRWFVLLVAIVGVQGIGKCEEFQVLPAGVKAVWDLKTAYREATETRERLCINGLWQWQPADPLDNQVPTDGWGYFKVPGSWPGITDYMQKDCQTVYRHPRWEKVRLDRVAAAWYQRQITIPSEWQGRRILFQADYVNSYAAVYIDGRRVGEIVFPTGAIDLSQVCQPGRTYTLSALVVALPMKAVLLAATDSNSAREVRGSVPRRGFCGDLFLVALPKGPTIDSVRLESSFRNGNVKVLAQLRDVQPNQRYCLKLAVRDDDRIIQEALSPIVNGKDLKNGEFVFVHSWRPEKLWDIHTPANQFWVNISLCDETKWCLDEFWAQRWGFREFWIEGRDFYLNGSRIFLSAVPLDNAQVGAAWASYEGARETLRRLKSFGINFVYTHNYDCLPGSHLSFEEILRAADDVGMLVALSQPHFYHYDWQNDTNEAARAYRQHAAFYVRVAGQHPSVVMYAMNHNATGYNEDMNPDLIDGIHDPRDGWSLNNARKALAVEDIVRSLDPSRVIYHHSSGNLSSMHTSNFYPNWVPIQELCDWFEHWSTVGVKPFFMCEYGAPFTWDWAMYRGWYKGVREFGSAVVPWDFCLAEWNAQFLGDSAYKISDQERRNIRWEAEQFRNGRLWHRWDYPHQLGSQDFDERYPIFERYLTECWRAFRTWEVSAISPWEHHVFWKQRPGLSRNQRVELATDWEHLQRPGFSPDYLEERYETRELAYEDSDWIPTAAAEAMYRNNGPVLGYIGGPPEAVTSHAHNFVPGETVEKQLIIINNSRQTVRCQWTWQFGEPGLTGGQLSPLVGKVLAAEKGEIELPTGRQARQPIQIALPKGLDPGEYMLVAEFVFNTGERHNDRFAIHVLPEANFQELAETIKKSNVKIGLFDPHGETKALLDQMGISYQQISAQDSTRGLDVLLVGKKALSADGLAPSIKSVRDGLKVIIFEQTGEVLEQRFGFRIAEYGLRNVFCRIPDHPYLAGLTEAHLSDWQGEATLLPPRLEYMPGDSYAGVPTVRWCGLEVPRLWRCGNRGNVASVLIEKPAVGDFLPVVDGGFSLQYSPLLEYREGAGSVLFCQLDITGRSRKDPAAEQLFYNILKTTILGGNQSVPERRAIYMGDPAGKSYLTQAGIKVETEISRDLEPADVLIVGKGGVEQLQPMQTRLSQWLKSGGHLLALELSAEEINALLPVQVKTITAEYVNSFFEPPAWSSPFAGISPADVHNRDPRQIPLLVGGCESLGGVLGQATDGHVIFCQLAPYRFVRRPLDAPQFRVVSDDPFEGQSCAEITMATVPWAQFGQKIPAGQQGKTYTFAAAVKPLDNDSLVRLEVERAGSPWDRVVRGDDVLLPANRWTQLQVSFTVKQAYPEGWQAYLNIGQPESRLLVDHLRLVEGNLDSTEGQARENVFKNSGFEEGSSPWFFNWNTEQQNLRKTFRRTAVMLNRVLGNLGIRGETPLLERFESPVVQTVGDSLVKNGQFNRDSDTDGMPDDWSFSSEDPKASCIWERSGPGNLTHSVRMSVPDSGERRRTGGMLAQHGVPIREGQWYRVAFWARADDLPARQFLVAVQETTRWQSLLEYQRVTPEATWREYVFLLRGRGTADKNTRFQIWFDGTGTLWLADVRIVPCAPPTMGRWSEGFYLDRPQEWDDPYRFFRW